MDTRRRWLAAGSTALILVSGACGGDDATVKSEAGAPPTTASPAVAAPPMFPAGTTMAAIQAKGKLVVGTRFDLSGFGVKNASTGVVEGFDVEIAKAIAAGIFGGTPSDAVKRIDFQDSVAATREASIKDGQVDIVVAAYRITDVARQQIDYAGPYFVAGQDLMVKSGETAIKGFTDLNGRKVCTSRVSGAAAANVKAKAPQAESIQFDTTAQCAEALADGRADAVASVNTSLIGPIETSKGAFRLVGNPSTEEPNGIGLKRGDDPFRAFLNDRLEAMYASGQWASAYAATLGRYGWSTPKPPAVDRYATASPVTTTSRP